MFENMGPLRYSTTNVVITFSLFFMFSHSAAHENLPSKEMLLSHSEQPPEFPHRFKLSSCQGTNPFSIEMEEKCPFRGNPTRTIVLGADFEGPRSAFGFPDNNLTFLTSSFGLGLSAAEASGLEKRVKEFYRQQFGIQVPSEKISLNFARFNLIFRKLADSQKLTPCANSTAVIAAWVASGADLSLGGRYAKNRGERMKRVKVQGLIAMYYFLLVFAPGSRYSSKMELRPTHPTSCFVTGSCGYIHETDFLDDYPETESGFADTSFVQRTPGGDKLIVSIRMTLGWPGRFGLQS